MFAVTLNLQQLKLYGHKTSGIYSLDTKPFDFSFFSGLDITLNKNYAAT
jgi:hypothetical protein